MEILIILKEFYPDMKTWVNYISEKFPGYIVDHGLGDWCPPGGNKLIDCPVSVSSTAFHYLDLEILKKTADILGYQNESSFIMKG
jgi:alpha-L-rhamnosidase